MNYHFDSKNFELHDAQKFIIDQGMAKIERFCKNFSPELTQANISITFHSSPFPSFATHMYLDIPGKKLSSLATDAKFTRSFNLALTKIRQQLRKHKEKLTNHY